MGLAWAEYHGVPYHDVIGTWAPRDPTRRVARQSFKVANETSSAVGRLTTTELSNWKMGVERKNAP